MKTLFFLIAALSAAAHAQVATSPTFTLEQSVIANGGGASVSPTFSVNATSGQSAAGVNSISPTFVHASGFWLPAIVPTAAAATVSGRVTTASGAGIVNANVTLTDSFGIVRTVRTGSFGGYSFSGVLAGETYVLSVYSRKFSFSNATRVISVSEDVAGVDFSAMND